MLGVARRMQPDRLVELFHRREERLELRIVERLAGDVGVDLHAERAVLDRALGFAPRRRRRAPSAPCATQPGKWPLILGADLREFVIDQPGIFLDLGAVAFGEDFERRHREGQNLRIVGEGVDDLPADVEIVDARHFAHALADVRIAAVDQNLEHPARHEMGIGVDAHETLRDMIVDGRSLIRRNDVEQRLALVVDHRVAGARQARRADRRGSPRARRARLAPSPFRHRVAPDRDRPVRGRRFRRTRRP